MAWREKIPRHEQRLPLETLPLGEYPSPLPVTDHSLHSVPAPAQSGQFMISEWKPAVCQGSGAGDDLIQRLFPE